MTARSEFQGSRHHDGCNCGCQHIIGLQGRIVQDDDTPKLAELGLVYVAFDVPDPAGGQSREQVVCYDAPRLFEPAPEQMPGQAELFGD